VLGRQRLFASLGVEERERLSERSLCRGVARGATLFREGEACRGLYLVLEGVAEAEPGVTGEHLLALLEAHLDSVIFRLGIAPTIRAARRRVRWHWLPLLASASILFGLVQTWWAFFRIGQEAALGNLFRFLVGRSPRCSFSQRLRCSPTRRPRARSTCSPTTSRSAGIATARSRSTSPM
jgi:hypothetical protein